jgi:hypothetical protein
MCLTESIKLLFADKNSTIQTKKLCFTKKKWKRKNILEASIKQIINILRVAYDGMEVA